ncbi:MULTISPECIES: hypothetical protein [Streptomyces]|uniref:PucR family transcriptional regulator n=1 Tax=Streptomyces luteosporeus TaxID=173856 RepID=A0ABN3TPW5_9ACTN
MDAVRVALLQEALAGTEWLRETHRFAGALRTSVAARGGDLLLVGTPQYEPWHLAAHLDDEAARSGLAELSPTLVRHTVPPGAPAHLAVGLRRLEAAGRGQTLLVVAQGRPGEGLLERVHDARRGGATVLTLEAQTAAMAEMTEMAEMAALAHEALTVPEEATGLDLDTLQHLVSAAAGEDAGHTAPGRRLRDRLARLADRLTAPQAPRW